MKHPWEQWLGGGGAHESLSIDSVCFLTVAELVEEFYLKICVISQMKKRPFPGVFNDH